MFKLLVVYVLAWFSSQTTLVKTADPYKRGYTDADFPRVQELRENVYSYEQLRSAGDEKFTTVSLFVVTDDGVLVADGQGNPEETKKMVDTIGTVTPKPITHVVICSDHGDHTGGNASFPRNATFYVHPTSRRNLETNEPMELVAEKKVLRPGGKEIRILFLGRAHTGGDLVVYLPEEKVLFMSEAYLHRVFPAMRSAYPSEWVAMIRKAQAMDVDVYVPGHGFVDSPELLEEELEVYRLAVEKVIAEAKRLHAMGLSAEQAAARANFGDLGAWSLSKSQAARAIARVYEEIEGKLP